MDHTPVIQLLEETPWFLVAYKPENILIHNGADNVEVAPQPTFTELLRAQFNDPDLFPCHRLDRVTSGVLLIAKGAAANSELSQLFQQRQVHKLYLALSLRKPSKKQGLIRGDMAAARNGSWKLLRSQKNPAITQFFSFGTGSGLRLFVLRPHTGKTHQLRVAMKSVGAPILGDERYGGATADRCYLHSYQIAFTFHNQSWCFNALPASGAEFRKHEVISKLDSLQNFQQLAWPEL